MADVFAGCGGLSHGFARTGRFDVVLGTDIDGAALETFHHNHAKSGSNPILVPGDIRELEPEDLGARLAPLGLDREGELDLLAGGPPCEGFSQNRRHEIVTEDGLKQFVRNPLDSTDPRNDLFRYFLDFGLVMRPKAILIENVPQMVTSHGGATVAEIERTLARSGYRTSWRVLNASHFGVPQARRRAFVVATRNDVHPFEWPSASHGPAADGEQLMPIVTVREAIADLPDATERELGRRGTNHYRATESAYAWSMRSDTATPMNHVRRIPGERVLTRLRAMRPGMISADLPSHLQTKSAYYNSYGRLSWDQPAKTITKSCNYLGSGCFGHPVEDRGITMREAARLQSFEDDFDFLSKSEPHVAKMVGSAVPPVLASALAVQIAKAIDG
ncbi:DNA cytosine methyltransferase [Rhodococcus gannanensis]|uniref:Cytosine-specific methyltransferase n=1 Tax=Rhodococcus gannanensis TaxID=1960308 RepID=A0ABW4P2L3_9NOCA